jgi:phage I-like protein
VIHAAETGRMKTLLALNTDLSAAIANGKAPEWVELIPAGPVVVGRDGRQWLFDEQAQEMVLSLFTARNIELPIDWEHATQHLAPNGQAAPAAAWITVLEIRAGGLWGRVNWTPRGGEQVAAKEYRFLSPVFDYEADGGRIVRLVSAGLTNVPNFLLTALNHEESEFNVKFPPALLALLGLTDAATEAEVMAAANQLKQAANTEKTPNLATFVPRADYETLLSRATNAEQALATRVKTEHESSINAEIDAALKLGKITPATTDYHRAACQEEGGLERFKAFVNAAPVVGEPSGLDGKPKPVLSTALNAEQQAMCKQFDIDPEQYLKTLQSEG